MAFQAMYVLPGLNGLRISASEEAVVVLIFFVASGKLDEEGLTSWLEANWNSPGLVDTPTLRKGRCPDSTSEEAYPAEFKRRMVALVRSGRSPEELAKEFGPSANTIRKWATQADIDEGLRAEGLSTAERAKLRELWRENHQLKLERESLVKAAAWVTRESITLPKPSDS